MSEKIRIGFVGCGGIARRHLTAWMKLAERGIDTFEIVAGCDTNRETAEAFRAFAAEECGLEVAAYTDLDVMLRESGIRAADICTTHAAHHTVAEACIAAGVDVQVEKPLGVTVKASRRIIAAAEKAGRIVAVAENIRRAIGMRTVRWLVQDRQVLGEPQMFFSQEAGWFQWDPVPPAMQWRMQRKLSGGFYAIDSGAHFLDAVRYLFGEVESVYARMLILDPARFTDAEGREITGDVEDSFAAVLTFASGLVGTWTFSRAVPGERFRNILYYGSKGSIRDQTDAMHAFQGDALFTFQDGTTRTLREYQQEYLLEIDPDERERLFPRGETDTVSIECFDFLEAVRTGGRPEVDGMEGLRAKAIADAMYESSVARSSVKVADVLDGRIEEYQRPINDGLGL